MKDARVLCPNCGASIQLRPVKWEHQHRTSSPLAAVCFGCSRVFTAEQWRQIYGPFPKLGGQDDDAGYRVAF